jgi:predicted PurR-regulated permease PerM
MRLADFTVRVLVALGLAAAAFFLWKITPVLMLLFGGIVLASVLRAASAPVSRRLRLPHAASLALVVVALLAAILGGLYFFGREIALQAHALQQALAAAYANVEARFGGTPAALKLVEGLRNAISPEAVANFARQTVTVFGALADIALVLFLAIYLAADPQRYRDGALRLFPLRARADVALALDSAGDSLRRWLAGQLVVMTTVGVAIGISLSIVGVPLAPALGVLSGLLEFVPVVGPIAGAIPGVLIAFAQGPDTALYAAIVYGGVLFVEGNVIVPFIQRWAVDLPPVLALLGIVAFGILFGLVGVLFAIPLVVVIVALVRKLYVERLESH